MALTVKDGLGASQVMKTSGTGTGGDPHIHHFNVDTITPGTGATALGKAEDAAHSSGDTGIMALAVRKDTAAALAGADGDYAPLEVDASGRLHVSVEDGAHVALGAKADAAATTDTGTFSEIALLKRLLTKTATGAANLANGQVSVSTSATQIVASRATRRRVTIKNTHASEALYVGIATVTSGNGMPLAAGESISLETTVVIQGIVASGTVTAAYAEEYD